MNSGDWPASISVDLGAVVTSMCVHHIPDNRKRGLSVEIFERLAPGAWYLNYDPVTAKDPIVEATWQRANDREDPDAIAKRLNPTPQERTRSENHVRYMISLEQQLGYLRSAGFQGIDVYWKHLENVIYGSCKPV